MSITDKLIQNLRRAVDRALTFSDDVVNDHAMPFDDLTMRDRALAAFDAEAKLIAATSTTPVDGEQADDFFCENCETHFTDKPHATADGCWLCDPCWRGLNEGTA